MAAKKCLICNSPFRGRVDAKTCSPRCRKRLQQLRFSLAHGEKSGAKSGGWRKAALLFIVGLFSFLALFFGSGAPQKATALTAASNLNFQGRLLTSGGAIVPDGSYNIDFKIYNADSTTGSVGTCTGACLWEETHLVASSQGVSVTNGYFSVNLGAITAFPSTINWDQQLYLTMNVTTNGTTSCTPATSCTWNGEMQNATHSIALTSVPLAFRANQLAVAGTNEQVLQFGSSVFGQTTTISLQDPGATTANICYETGTAVNHTCAAATGGSGYIQNQTASLQAANFRIQSAASGSIAAAITGASGQSVDIFDVNTNGNANPVLGVNSNGNLTFRAATSSATAFQIQDSSGNSVFNVDTTTANTNNKVANPSFETAVSNWSAVNGGSAGVQSSAQAYEGSKSLLIATNTTAGGGGSSYSTGAGYLASTTTYTLSAYVKTDSALPVTTFEIGRSDNGTLGGDTACLTAQSLPVNGGWQRFTCTFTTGATSGSPYIYFKVTDNVNRNLYIDDVLLQTDAQAQNVYRNASLSVSGTVINSPIIIQGSSNSSNALQVNNASGSQILSVSTNDNNLLPNPGFETNLAGGAGSGWTANGANTKIRRDTSASYSGSASLQVAITPAAAGGAQYALNPVLTTAGTTYTVSFYIESISGTIPTMQVTYDPTGAAPTTCNPTGTVVTTGWIRMQCTVSSATGPNTSGFLRIAQTNSAVATWNIDGVQMEAASVASAYSDGSVAINGTISSPLILTSSNASVNAFQIQNAVGVGSMFNVDTLNNRITIGDGDNTSSANSTLLVVDSGSTANRPAAVNGGIFYDSQIGHFVVVEGGSYKVLCNQTDAACGSGGGSTTDLQGAYNNTAGSPATITTTSAAKTLLFKAGGGFDATSLFAVQNAAGNNVLSVDTSSTAANNVVTIGKSSSLNGTLVFANSTNGNTITLRASNASDTNGAPAGNILFKLPSADGSTGQCLGTDGSGNLAFNNCSGNGGGGAGNANRQLSNLTGVNVNAALTPGTDNNINLDSSSSRYISLWLTGNLYTPDIDAQTAGNALGIGDNNAGAITIGNVTNSTVAIKTKQSATGFQVQDASSNGILTVNTTAGSQQVLIGKAGTGGINGLLTFNTATASSFTVGIAGSGSTTASYTLTLPTALPGSTQCIQSSNTGQLSYTTCGAGPAVTLKSAYTNGSVAGDSTIPLSTNTGQGTLILQDASSTIGNLFTIENNGATTNYLNVTNTTITTADNLTFTAAAGATISTNGASGDLTVQATGTRTLLLNTGGAGTVNLGTANSTTIGIGNTSATVSIEGSNSGINIGNGTTGHTINIGNGGTSAQTVNIGSSSSTGAVNLNSGNANISLTTNGASGGTIVQSATNSATAFQVKNSGGQALLGIDTTASNTNNKVANPSFESAISNWSAVGTGTAAQTGAQAYEGTKSLLITTGATQGGASYSTGATTFLSTNTTYTMSAYIKTDSSTLIHIDMGDEEATGTLIPCLTNQLLPANGGWQRFTCTWTTSGTSPTNSFIYFKQTSTDPAVTKNIYVDDVLVQTDAQAQVGYQNGTLNLAGTTVNSALVLQNASNGSTAFQVQNAAGTEVFNVDTTDTNMISNPGFEINSTGWSANGANTKIRRDTSASYTGVASLQVAITPAAAGGAQFALNPVVTAASATYTVSFYIESISGTIPTMQVTYDPTGAAPTTCNPTGTVVNTGWIRMSCQVSSATLPNTSGFIRIAQTNSAVATWNIDAVQLEPGTTATAYGAGNISLNAVIGTPLVVRNLNNSTTSFQVQNSSNNNVLAVDTINGQVVLGTSSSVNGKLVFNLNGSTNQVSIASAAQANNVAITIPADTNTTDNICLQSLGNCGAGATGGNFLVQQPNSNTNGTAGANVVTPNSGTAGIVALTLNGTANATSADVLDINSGVPNTATSTNGIAFNQQSAGTTTNGISISRTAGTLTNGLVFSGTIGTDIVGSGKAINITAAGTSIWQTTAGNLTLQATAASSQVIIDSGSSGTVTLGNSNATTVSIGGTSGSTTSIGGGASAHTVNIANNSGANNATVAIGNGVTGGSNTATVTIGSNNAAGSTTTINGGNGSQAILLQAATSGTIVIGSQSATTNNTIVVGNSGASTNTDNVAINNTSGADTSTVIIGGSGSATGTITIGQASTGNQTVSIESANETSSTQTVTIGGGTSTTSGGKLVNIATGAAGTGTTNTVHIADTAPTGTGTNAVTIGTTTNASTLLLQGGTSGSAIGIQAGTGGTILVGSANANTLTLGSNNASTVFSAESGTAQTNLFNGNTAHTIQLGAGGTSTNQIITIGSTNSGSTTTIQGGTTGNGVSIQAGSGGTIAFGNASAQTINIGSTSGNAVSINSGNANINLTTNGASNPSVLVKTTQASTAGFQVQNASSNQVLTVDTSANQVVLGKSATVAGAIVFNTAGAGAITVNTASTGSSFNLTLPTAGVNGTQCLQSTSGSTTANTALQFGSCGGPTPTLQQVYDASTSQPQITFDSSPGAKGLVLQDNASPITGNLFAVQNFAGNPILAVNSNGQLSYDTYTRSVALNSGWGSANVGGAWTTYQATTSTNTDFGVNGTQGQMNLSAANSDRTALLGSTSLTNFDIYAEVQISSTPTGSGLGTYYQIMARTTTASSGRTGYRFKLAQSLTNAGTATIFSVNTGVETQISPVVSLGALTPSSQYWLRARGVGTALQFKVWANGTIEPTGWTAFANDSTYTTGVAGVQGFVTAGGTNLPTILWDNYSATDTAGSVTTNETLNANAGFSSFANSVIGDNVQLSVGTLGTETSQLYVSGSLPTTALATVTTDTAAHNVVVQGHYAYELNYTTGTLQIIDITNPANPATIYKANPGGLAAPGTGIEAIYGHYLYIGNQNGATTFVVVDISNPSAPVTVNSISSDADPHGMQVVGHYLYMDTFGGDSFEIYDVSNPINPIRISDVKLPNNMNGISVQNGYAYLTGYGDGKLRVFNVSNPYDPQAVATSAVVGALGQRGIWVSGRYAYTADYLNGNLDVWDISNPASLNGASPNFTVATGAQALSVFVQGRYAYVSNRTGNTVSVVDISNPAVPVKVGDIATNANPGDIAVAGRYLYVPNGYGAAGTTMQIFDIGGAYVQQLQAGGTETGTLQVDDTATFASDVNIQGGLNVGGGATFQNPVSVGVTGDANSAFLVSDRKGSSVVNVSAVAADNLLADGNFEGSATSNIYGNNLWQRISTTETITTTSTGVQFGSQALSVAATTALTTQGTEYVYAFKPNTTYTFSVYASATPAGGSLYAIGAHVNGADIGGCSGLSFTTSMARYTCTFTTGATVTTSDYVFVQRASEATARTITMDGAQLEYGSQATPYGDPGFILQNLAGNSGFESSINNWSTRSVTGTATASSISQSNDFALYGNSDLKFVTGTGNGDILNDSVSFNPNTQYTMSFWARRDSGSAAGFNIGRSEKTAIEGTASQSGTATVTGSSTTWSTDGVTAGSTIVWGTTGDVDTITGSVTNTSFTVSRTTATEASQPYTIYINTDSPCTTNYTINTTWTQYTCTFTTGATVGPASSIYLRQTDTATDNVYIDGVTLNQGSQALPYAPPADNIDVNSYSNNITLNSTASGDISPWTLSSTAIPAINMHYGAATYNGYAYLVGGSTNSGNGAYSNVYYAPLNADGTMGSLSSTTSLPVAMQREAVVTVNGYIYAMGGLNTSGTCLSTVYYARINGDGSIGSWNTTTSLFNPVNTTILQHVTAAAANGYIYVIGGNSNGTIQTASYYVKVNSDGSLGSWTQASPILGTATERTGLLINNNFIYVIGGDNGTTETANTYYDSINPSTGAMGGSWTATTPLPQATASGSAIGLNGKVYVIGGITNSGDSAQVYYANLNSAGGIGAWSTSANPLPVTERGAVPVTANGYIYVMGGALSGAASPKTSIYVTSTSRTLVGGSLDLLGLSGQSLAASGSGNSNIGGALTAGNTQIVGTLQVQGAGTFSQGLSVNGITSLETANVSGSIPSSMAGSLADGNGNNGMTVSGRYAYALDLTNKLLKVIDVSNPAAPVDVSTDLSLSGSPENVRVIGHYAYVVTQSTDALDVIDISNPHTPTLVGSTSTGLSTPFGLYAQGRYVYVTNQPAAAANSLSIYDVSNPASPIFKGSAQTDSGTTTASSGNLFVSGNFAYITNNGDAPHGLDVFNISNPASPSDITSGGVATGTNPRDVYIQGRYAYVTDRGTPDLRIFDISNPASPSQVGTVTVHTQVQSVFVQGHYAYVTNSGDAAHGLEIINVSNVSAPVSIGSVTTDSTPFALYVSGRYAYVQAKTATANLDVFDLGGEYAQQLEAGGAEIGTLNVDTNASFSGDVSIQGGTSIGGPTQIGDDLGVNGNAYIQGTGSINVSYSLMNTPTIAITVPNQAAITSVTPAGGSSTTYTYQVVAVTVNGNSAISAGVSNSAGPAVLDTTHTETVTITAFGGATYYMVYRSAANGLAGTSSATTGLIGTTTSTTFVDTGQWAAGGVPSNFLTIGNTYFYKVSAIDAAGGETAASAEVNTGVIASPKQTADISWTAVTGAYAYKIYRSTTTGTEVLLATVAGQVSGTTVSFTDTGTITAGTATPRTTTTAKVTSNNNTGALQLTVGGLGTPTGQLYVSGSLPVDVTGGGVTLTSANDSYVLGRYEYVTASSSAKLYVFDISNPASPVDVTGGGVSTTAGPTDVFVQGHYAYVATGAPKLQVFDVSVPSRPVDVSNGGVSLASSPWGPNGLYVQGRYAYVSINTSSALQIFDISNPAKPADVTGGGFALAGSPHQISVQGNYAYVLANTKFQILNISNPAKPVDLTNGGVAILGTTVGLTVQGRYAYLVTDTGSGKLQIFDVSNPYTPIDITNGGVTVTGGAYSVSVQGRYAYITGLGSPGKLQVLDISNPNLPFDVSGGGVTLGNNGSTNSWLQVQGRYAYAVSNNIIQNYDLGGTYTQQLESGGAEFGTLSVDGNSTFAGDIGIQGGASIGGPLQTNNDVGIGGNAYIQGTGSINVSYSLMSTPTGVVATNAGQASISAVTPANGASTTYTYEVVAVTQTGNSSASATLSNAAGAATLDSTHTETLTINAFGGTVYMYMVYRTASTATAGSSSASTGLIGTTTTTSFVDTGQWAGGTAPTVSGSLVTTDIYRYKVTALDAAGNETAASSEVSATATSPFLTNDLSWTGVNGAYAYNIYRTAGNGASGSEVYLTTVSGQTNTTNSTLAFTDTGTLTAGTATPPTTSKAKLSSNNNTGALQLTVGGLGTPTGQVYISGSAPTQISTLTLGNIQTLAIDGKYAYLFDGSTNLRVIDVSNPLSPVQVATSNSISGNTLAIQGKYLYSASNNLMVSDISNPTNPVNVGATSTGISTASGIYVQGHYAYVVNRVGNSLSIYDVSNPASPTEVSSLASGFSSPWDIYVQGRYAYVAGGSQGNLAIIDVGNPFSPVQVGSLTGLSNPSAVQVSGRYAYVGTGAGGVNVVDVSVPSTPVLVGRGGATMTTSGRMYLQGRYIYETNGTGTLSVVDVSNPNFPFTTASATVTQGQSQTVIVKGRYAYVASATNVTGGLAIFDLGGAYVQQLEAGGAEVGTLTAQNNAQFASDVTIQGGLSVGQAVEINGSTSIISDGTGTVPLQINNASTGINLLQVKDLNTNFGSAVTAGAFISRNSYFGEEFNVGKLTSCGPLTGAAGGASINAFARGDMGGQGTAGVCSGTANATINGGELNASTSTNGTATFGTCQFASPGVTTVNGVERITATSANTVNGSANCVENLAGTTTTSNRIYLAANLPVITMKVEPSTLPAATAASRVQIGLVSADSAAGAGVNSLTNSIYFTNCSTWNNAAVPTGCSNTTWYGVTSGASAATVVTCSTATATLSSNFSYLRIEVRSTTDVHFFADYNTTNGIVESECGTGSQTNITASAMTPWMQAMYNGQAAASTALDIDYFRGWQDDNIAPPSPPAPVDVTQANTLSSEQTNSPITPDPNQPDPNVPGSFFNFLGATSEDTVINGNLFVHGTIYADKIKANEIEGLSVYTNQLDSLQAQLNAVQAASTTAGGTSSSTAESSGGSNGALTLNIGNSGLTVGGDANFNGNVFFYKLVTFVEKTVFNNDVAFNGHITTGGAVPTVNLESAAGMTVDPQDGQTHNLAKDSISGNDNSGQLSITIGDNSTAGAILTVDFSKAYASNPNIFLTPTNQAAAALRYFVTSTASGYKITFIDAPTPGTTLNFNYLVIQ